MVKIINFNQQQKTLRHNQKQQFLGKPDLLTSNFNITKDTVSFTGILKTQQPEFQPINIINASERLNKASQLMQDLAKIFEEDQKRPIPVFEKINKGTLEKIFQLALQGFEKPVAIGITGGSAVGKTTISDMLYDHITAKVPEMASGRPLVQKIRHDNFYPDFSKAIKEQGADYFFKNTNLDVPDILETSLLVNKLTSIKEGKDVRIPKYYFDGTGRRIENAILIKSAPIVLIEGLFTLNDEKLRDLLDLKVFIDASKEVRADRWWARAIKRTIKHDESGETFFNRTFTMHEKHVEPIKDKADIIINSEADIKSVNKVLKQIADAITKPVLEISQK